MKKWRVFVNGTNFKMVVEEDDAKSRLRRMGFFTNVFVTASTAQEAELRAVAVLRRDKALCRGLRNTRDDPPVLFVDEIHELRSFRGCHRPRSLVLYGERGRKRKR